MAPKPRVHQVAAELGVDSKVALRVLKELGEFVKSPSSTIKPPVARKLRARLQALGYVSRHFPGVTREASQRISALLDGLPRSLPRLVDELADASPRSRAALAAARSSQQVFYVAPEHHRTVAESDPPPRLSREDLPRGDGLMFLHRNPALGHLVTWHHSDDDVRFAAFNVERYPDSANLVAVFGFVEFRARVDDDHLVSAALGFRRLARAFKLVPVRVRGLPRESKGGLSSNPPQSEAVTVVRYRRGTPAPDENLVVDDVGVIADAEARRAQTRWLVRGHWRNQYYASEDTNKPVWIEEHTAGAPDAPIVRRDRVLVIAPDSTALSSSAHPGVSTVSATTDLRIDGSPQREVER